MAINALIAQGVQPIGSGLPQVAQLLHQREQQQQQNALQQMMAQIAQQNAGTAATNAGVNSARMEQEQASAAIRNLESVANDPVRYAQLADAYGAHPLAQKYGITAELLKSPGGLDAARARLNVAPQPAAVPFDQSDEAKKIAAQSDAAMKLEQARAGSASRLEAIRAANAQAIERMRLAAQAAKAPAAQAAGKPAAQAELEKTWNAYQTARDGLLRGLSASETGPVAGRIPAFTAAQQTAEGAVSAMAPVLKQIFRVAGEGTFTDRDQALLLEMVPKRTDKPEARRNKIQNIDAIVRAKLGISADAAPLAGGSGWSIEEVK